MIIMTIINVVILLIMAIISFSLWQMLNSFAEIIVKFVEQNQEYYKNQKHLIFKSNDLASSLQKIQHTHSSMKKVVSRLESLSRIKE